MRARGDSLTSSKGFFHIYSRDAEDDTPVKNRVVVGFKYPYSSNRAWPKFQLRTAASIPSPAAVTVIY